MDPDRYLPIGWWILPLLALSIPFYGLAIYGAVALMSPTCGG